MELQLYKHAEWGNTTIVYYIEYQCFNMNQWIDGRMGKWWMD
jgi:hypothetical protein